MVSREGLSVYTLRYRPNAICRPSSCRTRILKGVQRDSPQIHNVEYNSYAIEDRIQPSILPIVSVEREDIEP